MPGFDVRKAVLCGIPFFARLKPDRYGLSFYRLSSFLIDPTEINRAVRRLYKFLAGFGFLRLVEDARAGFAECALFEDGFDLGGSEDLVFCRSMLSSINQRRSPFSSTTLDVRSTFSLTFLSRDINSSS